MSGRRPIEAVTSRWYNLLSVFAATDGDAWVHSDGERLFWTKSVADEFNEHAIPDPFGTGRSYLLLKRRCEPWRDIDARGRRLDWRGLHPKSHDFLRTEATFQEIANDRGYRDYVHALLAGDTIDPWHAKPDWRSRAGQHGMVRQFDPLEVTIEDAVRRVEQTTRDADGREVVATRKIKDLNVPPDLMRATLRKLYLEQEGYCALTGLRMLLNGEPGDDDFRLSVDRIDSQGHYDVGNVQLVCRFANFWKSASDNARFKDLVTIVRAGTY